MLLISAWLYADSYSLNTTISIDQIIGHGVNLGGIAISFDAISNGKTNYVIEIDSIILAEKNIQIKNIAYICNEGIVSSRETSCTKGELSFSDPILEASSSPAIFYLNNKGDFSLSIDDLQLAGGTASVDINMEQDKWVAHIDSQNVSLSKLHSIDPILSGYSVAGLIKSKLSIEGDRGSIQAISGNFAIERLGFTNHDSTMVGESVAAKVNVSSSRTNQLWETNISSTLYGGELYTDPVFIDANENPKDIYGKINWQVDTNQVHFVPLHIEDQNVLHLEITTSLDFEINKPVAPVKLNVHYAVFPDAYDKYLQPFILDSNLNDLKTSGSLKGLLEINETEISKLNLEFNRITFIDNQKRFALFNLDGALGWGSDKPSAEFVIGFESADIYKVRLGETNFSFTDRGGSLALNQIANVSVLDGSLNIESFVVTDPGKKNQAIALDLSLTPVSMKKVSSVLDWPEMSGDLAGYAPSVVYKQGNLDVQGALLIRAFGGSTTIHNLKALDLFSVTPKLFADLKIQNIDLGSLTETFSFGEITGKLDGYINDLQFVSWQPIQFNAWLGTPPEDNSSHRISQRAVDNLTQIGNGASNIFSKSFLRFLDSFRYDRLGIGCRLYNTTCKMRGVSDSGQGFYIVKGSGIPRIDIIGYTEEVSWPILTARIKRVISTQDIVVQ